MDIFHFVKALHVTQFRCRITKSATNRLSIFVLFATDLSEENISIIEEIIAHKQIASVRIVIEVV